MNYGVYVLNLIEYATHWFSCHDGLPDLFVTKIWKQQSGYMCR